MNDWKNVKLGDIADMCLGKMLNKETNKGELQPYLANINVRWGGFDLDKLNLMRFEEHEQDRYGLKYGDIVMCEGGEPGRCAIWKQEAPNMKIQKALHRIRIKEDYSNEFIYYRFLLAGRNGELEKHFIGSTIKHLTGISLKKVEFAYPSLEYQQKIAAVLSALDAKIELNARINATLESMAKTLYDYWFVQNKEKENWRIGKLGDVADNIRRSANPNEIKPETHYIGLEHMPRKSIALAEYGNASEVESNKYAFKTGEFLFGKLRPYFHKVGIAPIDGVCSTDILVIVPKSPEWYGFVLGHISSDEIIKYADATSGGTKMPRTNWESLSRFQIAIPPIELAKKFSEFFIPVAKQIRTNVLESQTLTDLRDWLLPMLMNGQVVVK